MRRETIAGAVAVTVSVVSAAGPARAEDTGRQRALELGRRGIELYNQRRWVDAYDQFSRADQLLHSPVFVLYMARAKAQIGELVEARRLLRRVIDDESIDDRAPAPWQAARRDATEELEALAPRIPEVTIRLDVERPEAVTVAIDGQPIVVDETPRALDPGEHRIIARCGQGPMTDRKMKLKEGDRPSVTLTPSCTASPAETESSSILPPPPHQLPHQLPHQPLPAPAPNDEVGSTQRLVGAALMIAGGGLLAVGIGTGIGAIAVDGQLSSRCDDDLVCPPSQADDVARYDALAHTSTATLTLGGLSLVAGFITHWVAPDNETAVSLSRGILARF